MSIRKPSQRAVLHRRARELVAPLLNEVQSINGDVASLLAHSQMSRTTPVGIKGIIDRALKTRDRLERLQARLDLVLAGEPVEITSNSGVRDLRAAINSIRDRLAVLSERAS